MKLCFEEMGLPRVVPSNFQVLRNVISAILRQNQRVLISPSIYVIFLQVLNVSCFDLGDSIEPPEHLLDPPDIPAQDYL